jgi:hypothetical protein
VKPPIDATNNTRHYSALMEASERGFVEIVDTLITAGANKWLLNREGRDAMKLAWMQGSKFHPTNTLDRGNLSCCKVTSISPLRIS